MSRSSYSWSTNYSLALLLFMLIIAVPLNSQAAIQFEGASEAIGVRPASTITIPIPAGTSSGELMIATMSVRWYQATVTPPAGWTTIIEDTPQSSGAGSCDSGSTAGIRTISYYKVAGSSESAPIFSYSSNCNDDGFAAAGIVSFSGVDTSNPIVASNESATGYSTSHTAPSVNSGSETDTMLITVHSYGSSYVWSTAPTGMTERINQRSYGYNDGKGTTLGVYTQAIAAAGATGTRTAVGSSSSDNGATHSILLREDGGAAVSCVTFRDEFSSSSYSRNDGTANWSGNWSETGDNGSASNGDIEIDSGTLDLEGDGSGGNATFGGPSIEREADLSGYSSATLTFDYSENGQWEGSDYIDVWVSSDGGSNWSKIITFQNDQGSSTQSYPATDLTSYIASNFRIAFVERANSDSEIFHFDNVQIEACGTSIPTVTSQTTSDTTPTITGTYSSAGTSSFSVTVNGTTYTLGTDSELTTSGNDWTLNLDGTSPLSYGTYDITATAIDNASNTTTDATTDELVIANIVCETYRDNFSSTSYSNSDGTASWSTSWSETGDNGTPNSGRIQVTSGQLQFINGNSGEYLERTIDLSSYTSATLKFDYSQSIPGDQWESGDHAYAYVLASSDTLSTEVLHLNANGSPDNGDTETTYSVNHTINSSYLTNDFKIRYSEISSASDEIFKIHHVEVEACTTATGPDHYEISYTTGSSGVTCEAHLVTVTAHDASHNPMNVGSDTPITISTSPAVDAITSSPVTIPSGSSSATFYITETSATAAIDIDVTDGTATESTGSAIAADDPTLAFASAGFRFVDSSSGNAISFNSQIGGKPSSTAPSAQTIGLQAIRTDNNTGECQAVFVSQTTSVDLGYECNNPTSCTASNLLNLSPESTYNSGTAVTLARNDDGSVASYSSVNLDFNASGIAPLSFVYDDAGQITLHATKTLTADGSATPPTTAATLTGSSNAFVTRPFGFDLDFSDNRDADWTDDSLLNDSPAGNNSYAANANGSAFIASGTNFPMTITSILWQAADDSDNDGIPDAGANLTNNGPTLNFGQEIASNNLTITSALDASMPGGSVAGTFTATGVTAGSGATDFSAGVATSTLNWDEVGIIDITTILSANYLGSSSNLVSSAPNVGRFTPQSLAVVIYNGSYDNTYTNGTDFTYIGEGFGYLTGLEPTYTIYPLNISQSIWTQNGAYAVDDYVVTSDRTNGTTSLRVYKITASDGAAGTTEPTWPTTTGNTVTLDGVTYEDVGLLTSHTTTNYARNSGQFSNLASTDFTTIVDATEDNSGLNVTNDAGGVASAGTVGATPTYNGDGSITFSLGSADLEITKTITPIAPFTADIDLTLNSFSDSDGISSGAVSAIYTPVGNTQRYGRITGVDAMVTGTTNGTTANYQLNIQHYDGSHWITNSDDSETSIAHTGGTPAIICADHDLTDSLDCTADINIADATIINTNNYPLVLNKNIGDDGGTAIYTMNNSIIPSYLHFDWDGDDTVEASNEDSPSASITFAPPAYYHGNRRFIYWREQNR